MISTIFTLVTANDNPVIFDPAIISLIAVIIAQIIGFAFWLGKLSGRISSLEENRIDDKEKFDKLFDQNNAIICELSTIKGYLEGKKENKKNNL